VGIGYRDTLFFGKNEHFVVGDSEREDVRRPYDGIE
jgi:hypothetical protein